PTLTRPAAVTAHRRRRCSQLTRTPRHLMREPVPPHHTHLEQTPPARHHATTSSARRTSARRCKATSNARCAHSGLDPYCEHRSNAFAASITAHSATCNGERGTDDDENLTALAAAKRGAGRAGHRRLASSSNC